MSRFIFSISRFFSFLNKNIENILLEQYIFLEGLKSSKEGDYVRIKDVDIPNITLKKLAACMEERLSISISETEFSSINTMQSLKALVIEKVENKKN